MKRILLIGLLALAGCETTPDEAADTLDKAGFTNIKTGDSVWFGCDSKGDKMGREFTATNSNGRQVSGVVCCGTWKRCTIRF